MSKTAMPKAALLALAILLAWSCLSGRADSLPRPDPRALLDIGASSHHVAIELGLGALRLAIRLDH